MRGKDLGIMPPRCLIYGGIIAFLLIGNLPVDTKEDERPLMNHLGQRGLSQLNSAHTLGAGMMGLGIYGDGTADQNFLKSYALPVKDDTGFALSIPKPRISTFNFNPFIGAGLTDFFDVGVTLPVAMDMVGSTLELGIGDLRLSFKVGTHSAAQTPVFDMGFLGALILPTGNSDIGFFPRHTYFYNKKLLTADTSRAVPNAYFTSRNADFETRMMLTLDLGALKRSLPFAVSVDYGMHFSTYPSNDNAVLMSGGIEYHPLRVLALYTEFNSEMRLHNFSHVFKFNRDPLHITPGIAFTSVNGMTITMGSEISLAAQSVNYTYVRVKDFTDSQRISTGIEPKWRVFTQIGWSGVLIDRDRDRDGIFDKHDRCPNVAEDVDGFEDDDGCPDYDNDRDGIPDSLDKCPNKPEDKDGFQDDDGCPDYDNDNDRIPDSLDKCPNAPEDYDGFLDKDGCPDYDNDADMVPDSIDKCPDIPEDIDGFQDNDGCPDVDNDQDGVPDSLDKCPNEMGKPENSGCAGTVQESPKTTSKEIKRGRVILRGVTFEKGAATMEASSFPVLDQVAASLIDWPVAQLEIQGHTDNEGNGQRLLDLSTDRANAVRNYLVGKGIAPHRLVAVGKGANDPIAENATKPGREMNNRIEMRRIDP